MLDRNTSFKQGHEIIKSSIGGLSPAQIHEWAYENKEKRKIPVSVLGSVIMTIITSHFDPCEAMCDLLTSLNDTYLEKLLNEHSYGSEKLAKCMAHVNVFGIVIEFMGAYTDLVDTDSPMDLHNKLIQISKYYRKLRVNKKDAEVAEWGMLCDLIVSLLKTRGSGTGIHSIKSSHDNYHRILKSFEDASEIPEAQMILKRVTECYKTFPIPTLVASPPNPRKRKVEDDDDLDELRSLINSITPPPDAAPTTAPVVEAPMITTQTPPMVSLEAIIYQLQMHQRTTSSSKEAEKESLISSMKTQVKQKNLALQNMGGVVVKKQAVIDSLTKELDSEREKCEKQQILITSLQRVYAFAKEKCLI